MPPKEEYWLSGPVAGVPALLQPVAHALLQARDEILSAVQDINESRLWERPNELASVGFHLKHIVGVLDRLFTYAQRKALSAEQMAYLSEEGRQVDGERAGDLLNRLSAQIDRSVEFLKSVDPATPTDARAVGEKAAACHCAWTVVSFSRAYDASLRAVAGDSEGSECGLKLSSCEVDEIS